MQLIDLNQLYQGRKLDNIETYSNYTIIPDTNLPTGECDDVISSIDSLYDNLDDVLTEQSVTKSLPDYVDGENKEFECIGKMALLFQRKKMKISS